MSGCARADSLLPECIANMNTDVMLSLHGITEGIPEGWESVVTYSSTNL